MRLVIAHVSQARRARELAEHLGIGVELREDCSPFMLLIHSQLELGDAPPPPPRPRRPIGIPETCGGAPDSYRRRRRYRRLSSVEFDRP